MRIIRIICVCFIYLLFSPAFGFAQGNDIDFNLDISSKTKATPQLLRAPGVDLSGRGFHNDPTWPQTQAAPEVVAQLDKLLELRGGMFRMQFDLWEFIQLAKNKQMQTALLDNYSGIIKNINAAVGITLLVLYGMPPGLGKVLDKTSSPWDIKAFKELVKDIIRYLSCEKGYNIWYEVWNAPDLDDFFLGQEREYLNIYRAIAESAKELEGEINRNIPVGGPGVTWWAQNLEGNTVLFPERSLIYELIRFCSQRRIALDFISWHAYTCDPLAESEATRYKNRVPELIREWLSYFGFDSTTPLIISEWNFDNGLNFEPKRGWESYVSASFIPSRIRGMLKAGIDYQIFFCLEDFKNNKQGVNRNLGLFWFEPDNLKYTGGPKSTFNVIRMLKMLGSEMFLCSRLDNNFNGIIATKDKTKIALLLFNYIDPQIAENYLSRHLAELAPKQARALATLVHSNQWQEILGKQIALDTLRSDKNIKALIKQAIALNDTAISQAKRPQNINLNLTRLEGSYNYKKYVVDKSCCLDCAFTPREEKEIRDVIAYKESITLDPYSVVLIILERQPPVAPSAQADKAPKIEDKAEAVQAASIKQGEQE